MKLFPDSISEDSKSIDDYLDGIADILATYTGRSTGADNITSFIKMNEIDRGILLADKGFTLKNIEDQLKIHKDLHFLFSLKRDSALVSKHNALSFDTVFKYGDKTLQGKKVNLSNNGRFLYSFRDVYRAGKEDQSFIRNAIAKNNYDAEVYEVKGERFGTIAFISDLDLPLEDVYKMHDERWLLELMFAQYKGDIELTTTNVQGDFAVKGAEFINFIATVLTSRVCRKAEECGALDDLAYGDMRNDLSSVWRSTKGEINCELPTHYTSSIMQSQVMAS